MKKTCEALPLALKDFLQFPKTQAEWLSISERFQARWDFPHVLEDSCISIGGPPMPYFFLADGGFRLGKRIMKPFPGSTQPQEAIYNFRLSHARNVIENAFGILAGKWRILSKLIETAVKFADKIVASCIHLHNFVMDREREGQDRHEESLTSAPVRPRAATSATSAARAVRQNLVQYFQNEGAVEIRTKIRKVFTSIFDLEGRFIYRFTPHVGVATSFLAACRSIHRRRTQSPQPHELVAISWPPSAKTLPHAAAAAASVAARENPARWPRVFSPHAAASAVAARRRRTPHNSWP
ncbi:hypothetical protein L596_020908 [Steinernema carpocapsae]|uniref:DDE Tnp4 domain-containing protein n=1 Tax=Steinernema carpocapsae TaxID=34508 RepID=A0A4V6A123_STECR|nr:hypothetical protein L596_020908 [Steinernema carpocapsae]